jgi:hypothetical protein
MFKVDATIKERGSRAPRSRRVLATICALALAAIASGSVAAAPLARDDNDRETPLWIGLSPQLVAKLGTKAGYEVLRYG